jgi:hypothetical protein
MSYVAVITEETTAASFLFITSGKISEGRFGDTHWLPVSGGEKRYPTTFIPGAGIEVANPSCVSLLRSESYEFGLPISTLSTCKI